MRFRPDNKKTDVRILFAYTYVKKSGCVFRTYKKRTKNGYCVNLPLGRKPIFPAALAKKLLEYCMVVESRYFGLTRKDVQEMAFALAKKMALNIHSKIRLLEELGLIIL